MEQEPSDVLFSNLNANPEMIVFDGEKPPKIEISNPESVVYLSLVDCNLRSLETLPDLPKLRFLDISRNPFDGSELGKVQKYENLKFIVLSRISEDERNFPKPLLLMKNLVRIILRKNFKDGVLLDDLDYSKVDNKWGIGTSFAIESLFEKDKKGEKDEMVEEVMRGDKFWDSEREDKDDEDA